MRTALISSAVLLSTGFSFAQSNGIRIVVPALESVFTNTPVAPFMGFGYDHDFDEHIGMSLEATFMVRNWFVSDLDGYQDEQLVYNGWQANWTDTRKAWSVIYRSAFFFSGSSSSSFYAGTSIGVRGLKREVNIIDQYELNGWTGSDNGPFKSLYAGDAMVFPLGLRLGVRGPLDGSFYDLYAGLGYQLGGGDDLFRERELLANDFRTRTLTWHIGLAYGFGW